MNSASATPACAAASGYSCAFRWALRWRRKRESLTVSKLWRIRKAFAEEEASGRAAGEDVSVISARLACAACALTFREMQRTVPGFAESPRAAAISKELSTLPPMLSRPDPQVDRYLIFLEREIPRIESLELGQHALPWVLQRENLVSDDGLWLEFGVAGGASLCMIAAEARRRTRTLPVWL